jgi:hypothetical protein
MEWLKRSITLGEMLIIALSVFVPCLIWAIQVEVQLSDLQLNQQFTKTTLHAQTKSDNDRNDRIESKIDFISTSITSIQVQMATKENIKQ